MSSFWRSEVFILVDYMFEFDFGSFFVFLFFVINFRNYDIIFMREILCFFLSSEFFYNFNYFL